ncbi:MAG: histidine kinase [Saprospiraceae bacterium]|nr:histidine kinase [Saprospiraceae bacterium]
MVILFIWITGENNIYLSFSTLNLHEIQNTNYFIKIDGISDTWELLKNKGEIEYKNLSPGKYKIHIKASKGFINEESAVKTIHLYIEAPFYYRWWFFVLVAGLITTLVVLYERKKRREIVAIEKLKSEALNKQLEIEKQQRDIEEIKNKLTELKLSNLQSRMNPHFIFNTLNSSIAMLSKTTYPKPATTSASFQN